MKILHTSDWHLGKSLKIKPRLPEQKLFLDYLIQVCKDNAVDVVIVAGDIFDTFVPKAEAEELFFDRLAILATLTKVVCLAGNHDAGDRLCAPSPLARLSNIFLVGGMDNSCFSRTDGLIEGGDGWLRFNIDGQRLNLALLPYPFFSGFLKECEGESNEERVGGLIERCCAGFGEGVNVFVSHLFISGSDVAEERELGTAPILPKSILPPCDYVALGHIHKPQRLSRSRHIYYSGSPLSYSFDDTTSKFFMLFDSDTGEVSRIPIEAGQRLVTAEVSSFDEAEYVLEQNADAYVKLVYNGAPLTLSEIKKIKSYDSFTDIFFLPLQAAVRQSPRADASPAELFFSYYKARQGEAPPQELVELFLDILGGER